MTSPRLRVKTQLHQTKNTEMDVGLGFLAPLLVHLGKLKGATKSASRGLSTNADVVVMAWAY